MLKVNLCNLYVSVTVTLVCWYLLLLFYCLMLVVALHHLSVE